MRARDNWLDWLKLCAAGCMVLDHLRFVLPGSAWLYVPGRFAFPIFAFVAAENFRLSSDRGTYLARLSVAGLLAELPYWLLTGHQGNILLSFYFVFSAWHWRSWWRVAGAFLCDYGLLGAASLFLLLQRPSRAGVAVAGAVLNPWPYALLSGAAAWWADQRVQCIAAPRCVRWLVWFYPSHLCVLLICKRLFCS